MIGLGTVNSWCENIKFRMSMVFTKKDMDRIIIRKKEDESVVLKADLHEMKYMESKRFINNLIALIREPFELDIIHGYNHGTVLRDMIHNDLDNPRIKSKTLLLWNEGETLLSIG